MHLYINTLLTLLLRSLTIIVGLSFSENCNTRDTVGDQGCQGNGNTRDAFDDQGSQGNGNTRDAVDDQGSQGNGNTRDAVGDQGSQGNGNTRDADCGGQEPSQIHVDKFISK